MKRSLLLILAIAIVAALGATSAFAGKPSKGTIVFVTKSCPSAANQKVYKGNVIVYVSGHGCVSVDDGVSVYASGDAVVAAHGSASIFAKERVTLFVYDTAVRCVLKGKGINWVNSTKWRDSILACHKP